MSIFRSSAETEEDSMKNKRQNKILELISEREIGTQEELATLLKEAGFRVTQATISRDIRELRITKMPIEKGRQRYVSIQRDDPTDTDRERYKRILKDAIVSMDTAQNILVVRTNAGMAMAVAAAIDGIRFSSIVGSLAGDDTVFLAVKSKEEAEMILRRIETVTEEA